MHFGVSMFHTDYSIPAVELARALEARGFESMWAPEHSHIPASRRTPFPGGGELPRPYSEVMDPFVVLSAAAAVTKSLKLGTGVCLVVQRDPIQTAKLVASIDQVSNGRFLFGVGGGWNAEEIEDHGTVFKTRFKLMRERIEAMKEIWTQTRARISRRVRQLPTDDGLAEARSETASADHRWWRLSACGTACHPLRRRMGARLPAVHPTASSTSICRNSSRWWRKLAATRLRCR